eukprot:1352066-Alexandrium_andersonii.AAC.1
MLKRGARESTNRLIEAIMQEANMAPNLPLLIAGDLNCEPSEVAALQPLLGTKLWNVGELPHLTGQEGPLC